MNPLKRWAIAHVPPGCRVERLFHSAIDPRMFRSRQEAEDEIAWRVVTKARAIRITITVEDG